MISREVVQGRQLQGEDERIAYKITTTPWAPAPTSPEVVVKDVRDNYADVSGTTLSGTPSIFEDVITLPVLHSLTAGKLYRVEVKFTVDNNDFEPYFYVLAER
jgi:hypothetical protein